MLDSEQVKEAQITMRAADYFNGYCGERRSILDVPKGDDEQELIEAVCEIGTIVVGVLVALAWLIVL